MALGVVLSKTATSSMTVTEVEPGSVAAQLGVEVGDRVTQVNETPVRRASEVGEVVRRYTGDIQTLTVQRGTNILLLAREGSQVMGVALATLSTAAGDSDTLNKLRREISANSGIGDRIAAIGLITMIVALIAGFMLIQYWEFRGGDLTSPYAGVGWALLIWGVAQCVFMVTVAGYLNMRVTATRYMLERDGVL
jgi:membrane-associated protease RseP (regulator of RpoE activity)